MRLPRTIRHWLLLKLADYEFTIRTSYRLDEPLVVVRQGCLSELVAKANEIKTTPACNNPECFQGHNAWHIKECFDQIQNAKKPNHSCKCGEIE